MKKLFTIFMLLISCLVSAQKNQIDWKSLSMNNEVPEWFKNAKFGIYFHWGVYSVPEFQTEWYPRYLYFPWSEVHRYHKETYGPISKFGYHDLIPLLKQKNLMLKNG